MIACCALEVICEPRLWFFLPKKPTGICGNEFRLAAIPGEAAFWPLAVTAVLTYVAMTCVKSVGAVVSYWGWRYGTSSPLTPLIIPTEELWGGWKSNWRGLRVVDKKRSLFYRNSLLIVLFSMFSTFMEGISHLRVSF
jgi:hypothetical protein